MNLQKEVTCLRSFRGGTPSPAVLNAARQLLDYLDGVLDPVGEYPKLPRGYHMEVLVTGRDGICVPIACESEVPDEQLAYFAADVACGWLEELCATLDPERAAVIRSTCGL